MDIISIACIIWFVLLCTNIIFGGEISYKKLFIQIVTFVLGTLVALTAFSYYLNK